MAMQIALVAARSQRSRLAVCYAAFAINWSSLQYTDHAFSKLDVRDGAWNLRVNPSTRLLFLNYHHHLAHHRHPQVPWIHLGRFVDPARSGRRSGRSTGGCGAARALCPHAES